MSTRQNKYGFVIWFVASLFVIYSFALNTAAGVFAEPIQKALSLSAEQASIAVSCFIVGFALFQVPAGIILDRLNNKLVICVAILCLALGCFLTSLSQNLSSFALANIIMGIGASFAFTAAGKAVSCWFSIALFPIMFGLTQTLSCILSGFIHVALSNALKTMTYSKVYIILAIVGCVLFVLNLIFFKNKKAGLVEKQNESESIQKLSLLSSLRCVVANKQVWVCSIVASFAFGPLMAYSGFWFTRVTSFYKVTTANSAVLGILMFAGIGIGTPLWGAVSNWVKSKKGVMHVTLSLGALFLLFAIYLPHFKFDSQLISYINGFCIGFFLSGSMLTYASAAEIVPPELTGLAISFVNMFVFIVNTLFLSLPYMFLKGTEFRNAFWLFPAAVIISICFLFFIKEEKTVSA